MGTDIFVARANCRWYTGEETLPHSLDRIPKERVDIFSGQHPEVNKKFIQNIDRIMIEPQEVALDKDEIKRERSSKGEEREVFEGELFFVIRVPTSLEMDPQEVLENVNVLLSVSSKHSSTKLTAIRFLGTNTY